MGIVSLGCSKTLVDSETLLGKAQGAHFSITQDLSQRDVVILNTCGFIKYLLLALPRGSTPAGF